MAKYIKTKSNYVLKKEHRRTIDGKIFERDYMTITDKDGFSPDNPTDYGQYKFRFVVNEGLNLQKKHQRGNWLVNDASCIEGDTDKQYWTEGCLPEYITPETKIVLNPNYETLRDFAYYGSALELVRASITDIIVRFPAELYFTNNSSKPASWGIPGTKYYVENDYGIDIHSKLTSNALMEVDNPIRYFSNNVRGNYVVFAQSDTACTTPISIEEWIVSEPTKASCENYDSIYKICDVTIKCDKAVTTRNRKNLELEVWNMGLNDIVIVSTNSDCEGVRIRPNESIIDDFFENLDGFEKVILNRKSVPMYTAIFKTPFETEDGYYYKKEAYTWPNSHGWNPSLSSYAYDLYVQGLVSLATYHDEYDTDNIWRSMTHEAIKNLDWTFTRESSDDIEEYETIDTSRVEPVLKVWGRQYDDIKRYIDNIKYMTNVSYNKENNAPDYFITDVLETAGWEVGALNTTTDNDKMTDVLYPGHTEGYSASEVNVETMRRLKLNSPYLFRMKGTVKGIKCLLALFGIDATIKEYTRSIGNVKRYTYETLCGYNLMKTSLQGEELPYDLLTGLPLKEALKTYDVEGNVINSYAVPWYDGRKQYDGDTYFQMKGGWAKYKRKVTNVGTPPSLITIDEWSETTSNLKFAYSMSEMALMGRLLVKTGDICYVENISTFGVEGDEGYYTPCPTSSTDTVENASHYFILKDDKYCNRLGWVVTGLTSGTTAGTYGWQSITKGELASDSEVAKKIDYYESIVDSNVGNNPHNGDGVYDGGEEFVNRLKNPFGQAIKNGDFDAVEEGVLNNISGVTFEISGPTEAAAKTKYYKSTEEEKSLKVVNDKTLEITFNSPEGANSETKDNFKNYVVNKLLLYIEQMIPSTTITYYKFN